MYPILFEYQNFILSSWHAFFFLAAIVAFVLTLWLTEGILTDLEARLLFLITYIGGYLGSRLTSILIDQEIFDLQNVAQELLKLGPMTSFGGLMGGFLSGSLFVILRFRERRWFVYSTLFDKLVKVGVLAIGVGRLGCFLNGDDYGIPVSAQTAPPWWAVKFPNHGEGAEYLVPVQLIEFFFCLLLFVVFRRIERATVFLTQSSSRALKFFSQPGNQGAVTVLCYAIGRFIIEFMRDDPRGGLSYSGALITPAQIWSMAVVVAVVAFLYLQTQKVVSDNSR